MFCDSIVVVEKVSGILVMNPSSGSAQVVSASSTASLHSAKTPRQVLEETRSTIEMNWYDWCVIYFKVDLDSLDHVVYWCLLNFWWYQLKRKQKRPACAGKRCRVTVCYSWFLYSQTLRFCEILTTIPVVPCEAVNWLVTTNHHEWFNVIPALHGSLVLSIKPVSGNSSMFGTYLKELLLKSRSLTTS